MQQNGEASSIFLHQVPEVTQVGLVSSVIIIFLSN